MANIPLHDALRWPEHAHMFMQFFAVFEHALKREGYAKNKERAEADWSRFAAALGAPFLDQLRQNNTAPTLIGEPPRKMMRDGEWRPEQPVPIASVEELFVRGVCQVRNNLAHGEKRFLGSEGSRLRANALVQESAAVLEAALETQPKLKKYFSDAIET